MLNRRPYIAGSDIKPGTAVVQGKADNQVTAPDKDGKGDFIGLYSFEANEKKAVGDSVGIVLHGVGKAVAGGTVTAGKKAILKADASGSLVVLPDTAGKYNTVGTFLEGGSAGDYVDVLIERGNVTL
jgi:hypothetical protein